MKVEGEIILDSRKITEYLLIWKAESDKSAFLINLGYTQANWQELEEDILDIIANGDAIYSRPAPFGGDLYKVNGTLRNFGVVTIWLYTSEPLSWRFVTLYPQKT
ncbi:hypothetical protein GO730_14170 [Spirosoma sp. HMF3257]|uniref:DUF6883 domain-containing protein n=1 Tax=Spirosoma telluris TaxID=2183553 RepID=A0A327NIR0_9BACT|nr:hypothetical protein [Spirosoma telluris]RAI75062.1 hypothetical protein HMF3257_14095 [Spirosoma telluris]